MQSEGLNVSYVDTHTHTPTHTLTHTYTHTHTSPTWDLKTILSADTKAVLARCCFWRHKRL